MCCAMSALNSEFLSTLPARGATANDGFVDVPDGISIHAPREGSDGDAAQVGRQRRISIHAPREGSDYGRRRQLPADQDFYPRSPRGERPNRTPFRGYSNNFYPRSPRGERPGLDVRYVANAQNFYPRSPRGERQYTMDQYRNNLDFYPRSPRGERPGGWHHANRHSDFYPRSPRGERLLTRFCPTQKQEFLSTLPARGATCNLRLAQLPLHTFLSTLPARGATQKHPSGLPAAGISIHAPREGSDLRVCRAFRRRTGDFYPRSPRGERQVRSKP